MVKSLQKPATPATPATAFSPVASSSSIPATPATASSATLAVSRVYDKLNSYINECTLEGGFDLQTQVHEDLASKKIILLRNGQQCKKLIEHVHVDSLLKIIKSDALKTGVKVDNNIYLKLATLFHGLNETIDRRAMKIKRDQLYAEVNEEDGVIIEVFSNLAKRLPNHERLSHVGEKELL